MKINLLYGIISFILILSVKLFYDYWLWKRGKPVNHPKEAGIFIALMTVPIYLFATELPWHWWLRLLYSCLMIFIVFWTLFDGFFNLIRREPWNFTGSVDRDDAKLDILQRKYTWIWVAKIFLATSMIIFYYITILP